MRKSFIYTLLIILPAINCLALIDRVPYSGSECGLTYVIRSIKITTREPNPAGTPAPVTFAINELVNCTKVVQAFVWWGVSYRAGTPNPPTLTVTNPSGGTSNFTATVIGDAGHKCWGELGTRAFRVDVTSMITTNGNYTFNVNNPNWETDGLTFMIIYRDLKANYEGHLIINDGLITDPSGNLTSHTMTGFNACANAVTAQAFMLVGDLQVQFNTGGQADFIFQGVTTKRNAVFWNFETQGTTVNAGQTSFNFGIDPTGTGGDCYSLIATGLYFRTTTCKKCPTELNINASVSKTSVCKGEQVNLNASGGANYNWTSDPPGVSLNGPSQSLTVNTSTDFIVKGMSADGCTEGWDTVRVTVNPSPVADAGPDVSICSGKPVTIGRPAGNGTPPFIYSWTPTTSLSDPSIAQPQASPTTPTTYILTITDANGCVDMDTVFVSIFPGPTLDAGPDKSVCAGTPVKIGAPATGGTPPYSYQWNPASLLDNSNIAEPIATANTTTEFNVTITDGNGCTASDTVTVNIFPSPSVSLGPDVEICSGSSAQIGKTATGGTAPFSYNWSPSIGLVDANSAITNASPISTTSYILTVTDGNGCINSDTIQVAVNPLPTINLGVDKSICYGSTVPIGVNASSGTPPYTYNWTPAQGLSQTNQAIVDASPLTTSDYIIEVTDSKGCQSRDTIRVNVMPLPKPVISPGGTQTICSCDSISLDAGPNFSSYLWSNGDTTRIITTGSSGTYTVTVRDAQGCVNTSAPVIVDVVTPEATISLPETILTAEPGQFITVPMYISRSQYLDFCKSINFAARISYNKSLLVPKGITPTGSVSGGQNRIIDITGSRKSGDSILYNFYFIATLGDTTETRLHIDSFAWTDCPGNVSIRDSLFRLTGLCQAGGITRLIRQAPPGLDLIITPNPSGSESTIEFNLNSQSYTRIILTDLLGKITDVVLDSNLQKGSYSLDINTGNLPSGYYFVTLYTESATQTQILEVEK